MFRRRRRIDEADDIDDVDVVGDDSDLDADDEAGIHEPGVDDSSGETWPDDGVRPTVPAARPQGPWDSHDVPDDAQPPRFDLGSMRVPVPDGVELRVEVQDDVVVAATFVTGHSMLQVHAFAAPKSSGVWGDVRREIAESLTGSAGSAQEADGPFGPELSARLPGDQGTVPARFLGVDGPRWFLRGLLTGPAATDAVQAQPLEAIFRDVVVHRGGEAIAPRDLLPLHLPQEAMQAIQADEQPPPPSLSLPERGPEITETR